MSKKENQTQKYVIQIIDSKTGRRSVPFTSTPAELAENLKKTERDVADCILVLGTVDDNNGLEIIDQPIISIETMLEPENNEMEKTA